MFTNSQNAMGTQSSTTNAVSPMVRLQCTLNHPSIQVRCLELSRIICEVSSKDAVCILRTVVESLFGVAGQLGWGLRNITVTDHQPTFVQLRDFLSATGPLLNLTYRLAQDPFQVLQFPIAYLPGRARSEIEDGTAGGFYSSKIQNPGPGKSPTHICLNAFEFYMFHFAHFLVSGNGQRGSLSWTSVNDALYPKLLEDYLIAFLPCDASTPPGPTSPPVSPRGVLLPTSVCGPNLHLTTIVSPIGLPMRSPTSPHSYAGFDVGSGGAQASSPINTSPKHVHHHYPLQPQQLHTWTSFTVTQILLEMWVNQSVPAPRCAMGGRSPQTSCPSSPVSQYVGMHVMVNNYIDYTPLEYRPNWKSESFEIIIPSSDHVRVVRMLVKHFHYFSNSIKSAQQSPLDELRKNLWPMCRKSFYQFLGHLFSHWPLDSSFKLVIETWLSYIQPWRYSDYSQLVRGSNPGVEPDGSAKTVEVRWQTMMAENLLFYTLLTEHLLGRLLRLDLSSAKNAQILFRLTKVLSQGNLACYLREIEEVLECSSQLQRSFLGPSPHSSATYPSQQPHIRSGVSSEIQPTIQSLGPLARAHIMDMEGPNHNYVPLFSNSVIEAVARLQMTIQAAYVAIANELVMNTTNTSGSKSSSTNWLNYIISTFTEPSKPSDNDATLEESRKTLIHLETSLRNITIIFNVTNPLDTAHDLPHTLPAGMNDSFAMASGSSRTDSHVPDQIFTPNGPILSQLGRQQLLSGMRRFDLKYEGNPDMKPICSYEFSFLVRWLYSVALIINEKYKTEMIELYFKPGFLGKITRVVLTGPSTFYEFNKGPVGSPHKRASTDLPPRIHLRFLAHKRIVLIAIALYVMFCSLLGHSVFALLIKVIFPGLLLWIISKAILSPGLPRGHALFTRSLSTDDSNANCSIPSI